MYDSGIADCNYPFLGYYLDLAMINGWSAYSSSNWIVQMCPHVAITSKPYTCLFWDSILNLFIVGNLVLGSSFLLCLKGTTDCLTTFGQKCMFLQLLLHVFFHTCPSLKCACMLLVQQTTSSQSHSLPEFAVADQACPFPLLNVGLEASANPTSIYLKFSKGILTSK